MQAVGLKPFRLPCTLFYLVTMSLLVSLTAHAGIHGPDTSDQEFAQSPLIVVAHWTPPAPTPINQKDRGGYDGSGTTQIVVDRVIKGDLLPGTYKLDTHVQWNGKGNIWLDIYDTSSGLSFDTVYTPNLWFLFPDTHQDPVGKEVHLRLESPFDTQPLCLEPYFRVLVQDNVEARIGFLLQSRNPDVVIRSLGWIAGEDYPQNFRYLVPFIPHGKTRQPLTQYCTDAKNVLKNRNPRVRESAAWFYWDLTEGKDLAPIRGLLTDRSEGVRAVAVKILLHSRDTESIPLLRNAIHGISADSCPNTIFVEAVAWGDLRLVPTVIEFLQSASDAGRPFDSDERLAVVARRVLHRLTGYTFPLNAKLSRKAWAQVESIPDPAERIRRLKALLGDSSNPPDVIH